MILWIYRLLVAPLLVFLLPLLALFNKKVKEGLRLRLKVKSIPCFSERPVWIHAASGEFEYSKSVIRELKSTHPHIPVVVTYFSPTYANSVQNFPGVDACFPLPLDLPGPCSSFLRLVNPRVLMIARTDFWPEILAQTRRRKIPRLVFSYTQKEVGTVQGMFTKWRLNFLDEVECVTAEDLANVQQIGSNAKAVVAGDTRYDQVKHRLDHPQPLPMQLKPNIPCFVAGSTWFEDERVLIEGLKHILGEDRLKLILVPHEPTAQHLSALKAMLDAYGLTYSLYSSGNAWPDKNVLIVDQVGVLAELYLWAEFAFVGGSFRKNVHSVMEALGAGAMTFVGPNHLNNREALEFKGIHLGGIPALQIVGSAADLEAKVNAFLHDKQKRDVFSSALKAEFESRLGASRKLVSAVQSLMG